MSLVGASIAAPAVFAAAMLGASTSTSPADTNTKRRRGQGGRRPAGMTPASAPTVTSRTSTWGAKLLKSPRLQGRLELLSDLGLSDSEIAQVFPDGGSSARSVRRWRLHGMARDREAARWQPVDNLCAIVGYLMSDGTFGEDAAVAWLRSRHVGLGLRRPLEVLGEARFADVLDAAEATLGIVVRGDDDAPGPISRAIAAARERGATEEIEVDIPDTQRPAARRPAARR